MSSVQPFQFEPKRNICEENNTEDITAILHQNEYNQRGKEERRECLCSSCSPMLTVKESACQQLFKVSICLKL